MLAYEIGINEDDIYDRFEFQLDVEPYIDDDGYEVRGKEIVQIRAIDSVTGEEYLADEDGDWSRLPE